MKWILIIVQFGYSCFPSPCYFSQITQGTNAIKAVQPSKERSQAMDRDSCFKAAETVKNAFPAAEVSCEVVP